MEWVWRARVVGPLAPHADGVRSELKRLGYTRGSAEQKVWMMGHLSRWLMREGLEPGELSKDRIAQFLAVFGAGCKDAVTERRLAPILAWLRDNEVVPPPAECTQHRPLDLLMERYHPWLAEDRRLAAHTIGRYEITHTIACHFAQGREYFRSASGAALLVRPLLLHYGVVALSRGLILIMSPGMKPEALSESHGLNCQQWNQRFASAGISDSVNLELTLARGTFTTLIASSHNRDRCVVRSGSSRILSMRNRQWTRDLPSPTSTVVRLGDVLARVPELTAMYGMVTDHTPECIACDVWVGDRTEVVMPEDSSNLVELRINDEGRLDRTDLDRRLGPGAGVDPEREQASWRVQIAFRDFGDLDARAPCIKESQTGGTYLSSPLPDGGYLSCLASLYIASFALGMMVRNYPSAWADLIGRATGDRAFPLLRATDELIEQRFPQLAAAEIELPGD